MGRCKGLLPLSTLSGREVTTDTLLLSSLAGRVPCRVCFDLGTGSGEVIRNANLNNAFVVGIDISLEALRLFPLNLGQPVLCSVQMVSSVFKQGCADLVLANPPYFDEKTNRTSPDMLRREARSGEPLLLHRFVFASAHLLKPGGVIILTGRTQNAPSITQSLTAAGFSSIEQLKRGKITATVAVRQSSRISENRHGVKGSI